MKEVKSRGRNKIMDIHHSASQGDVKRYTAQEPRDEFLIQNLYAVNEVIAVYSHVNRVATLRCMPTTETVSIDKGIGCRKNFGTHYSLGRYEIGILSTGGSGRIAADGQEFQMGYGDYLYTTKGTREVYFSNDDAFAPVKFYMVNAPVHTSYTIIYIPVAKTAKRPCGASETASKCVISQSIHPGILRACQPSTGMTVLGGGNVWNTIPSHTHKHRMEIYMYFEVPNGNVVFRMMGKPTETKYIVMKNREVVISPSWSIHSGTGTSSYASIWAMGRKNMEFDDVDTTMPDQVR